MTGVEAIETLEPDEDWTAGLSRAGRETVDALTRERRCLSLADMVQAWAASVRRIVSATGEDSYDDYSSTSPGATPQMTSLPLYRKPTPRLSGRRSSRLTPNSGTTPSMMVARQCPRCGQSNPNSGATPRLCVGDFYVLISGVCWFMN